MGRASRMKAKARAERQPIPVSIYNPTTGLVKHYDLTISGRSLAEWVQDRERLTGQGYPDRPPTYNGAKVRWRWANRGSVAGDPPRDVPAERAEERFVQSWAARHVASGVEAKILAFEIPSDATPFLVREKIIYANGGWHEVDLRLATWREVLVVADGVLALWDADGFAPPNIPTQRELAAITSQVAEGKRPDQAA